MSVVTGPPPGFAELGRVRAVVLDLDGVIVDSFAVMREAFGIAYAEVVGAGPAPFEEYTRYMGRYFPDIMRLMRLPAAMEQPFVRESYRLAHRIPVYPGVRRALEVLDDNGLPMAVATGKSGPRARSLLAGLGLLSRFAHVIGSDEVARPKPAPDIVRLAVDRLGVPPDEAVMVGDAATDVVSARGAGVPVAAALWGSLDLAGLLAAGPDAVLTEPSDLLTLCLAVYAG